MKKLFVSVLAIASLIACNKDVLVQQQGTVEIAFQQAFVDNATRAAEDPSTTNGGPNAIEEMHVWGFMDNGTGLVFDQQLVKKVGEHDWTYSPLQYWTPKHTYYFAAVSPLVDGDKVKVTKATGNDLLNGLGTISFKNDGTTDLLYSATTVSTENMKVGQAMDPVKFTFSHLLSKVKFSFTNGFEAPNYTIKVTNIKMTVPAEGSINVAQADWWTNNEWVLGQTSKDLAFGDMNKGARLGVGKTEECDTELFTIPTDAGHLYTISFDVELFSGEVSAYKASKVSTVTDLAIEMGKAYNFKATITPENLELTAIEFDVEEVKQWIEPNDKEFVPFTPAATAQELVAAVEAGDNVVLTQDIDIDEYAMTKAAAAGLVLANDIVIDGNGYKLSTTAVRAIHVLGAKKVTIKNLTLDAKGERGIQIQEDGQTLILENVKATSNKYTVHITQTSSNANVSIKNCELKGKNTLNVWGKNHTVKVENTTVYTEDNTEDGGFAAVYNVAYDTTVDFNGGEIIIHGSASDDTFAGLIIGSSAINFDNTKGDLRITRQICEIRYGDNRWTYETMAEAISDADEGDTIHLLDNIAETVTLSVDKKVTLDLNGYNITTEGDGIDVTAGELTVVGEGTVYANHNNAAGDWVAVWAHENGKVNLQGGEYKVGCLEGTYNDLIYAKDNALINVSGGIYYSENTYYKGNPHVLNIKNDHKPNAKIVVTGGKFENFDPANARTEPDQDPYNYVAAGYESYAVDANWFAVVKK